MYPQDYRAFLALGALVGIVALGAVTCSCGSYRESAAEASYLAQQLHCVDKANSREQADQCRAEVNRKWGIIEARKDGGK